MNNYESQFHNWCLAHKEEQLSLLRTLAAIPAPSHHEEQRAEFIFHWLESQGAKEIAIDKAYNVILSFSKDSKEKLTLYSAHIDTVFPDTTPLLVRENEKFLQVPGIGDNTANVIALMFCAKYLLEANVPSAPVVLAFNSCEEGFGNLLGIRTLIKSFGNRLREVVAFDLNYTNIVTRAVGSERWSISVSTPGGHSYNDFGSENAIALLSDLISHLYQQKLPALPNQKTTYNVGTIHGGTSINTIAQAAEISYEYRSDCHEGLAQMRKQFIELFEAANTIHGGFTRTLLGERPCGTAADPVAQQSLLHRCSVAVESVLGVPPKPYALSSDANLPLSLGIPATALGLCIGHKPHTQEEFLEKESLLPGLEIGLQIITSHFRF